MAKRTSDELSKLLSEQVHLLNKSCQAYDAGNHLEALRIATSLRVLLHDTDKSTSLLKLMQAKDTLRLHNSKLPTNGPVGWHIGPKYSKDGKMMLPNIVVNIDFLHSNIYLGLVVKKIVFEGEDILLSFIPVGHYHFAKDVTFDVWWNDIIFDNRNGITMSRKDTILLVANREGGTHINDLPEKYIKFKTKEVIRLRRDPSDKNSDSNPIYPTVRQLGYEVLESLKKGGLA